MSTVVSVIQAVRNEIANLIADDCNNGYIRIYSGTQPETMDDSITGTLLAEMRFSATSELSITDGVIIFDTITGEDSILQEGTATHYRCFQSDSTTGIFQGSVGLSNASMILADVDFVVAGTVDIDSFTFSVPA